MEWRKSSQLFTLFVVCIMMSMFLSQISAYPSATSLGSYSPDDYEQQPQGLREMLEELERQGGLAGPVVPRSYATGYNHPNHQMARKSQRSNTLRLRFGKRSPTEDSNQSGINRSSVMHGENPIPWKAPEDTISED